MTAASRWAVLIVLTFSAVGYADVPEETAPDAIDHLAVGDSYIVVVERHGVERRLEGDLVKANLRWIVLRNLSEGRNEFGVPVLSKLPYLNRAFKNVGIGREDQHLWIPREACTVQGRIRAAVALAVTPLAEESPPAEAGCTVELAENNKLVRQHGDMEISPSGAMHFKTSEETQVETPRPVLGRLPLVGKQFTTTHTEFRDRQRRIPHEDLLCIRVSTPIVYRKPAAEPRMAVEPVLLRR
jgi:hypothetical protein